VCVVGQTGGKIKTGFVELEGGQKKNLIKSKEFANV
jgi:hypothetical protein